MVALYSELRHVSLRLVVLALLILLYAYDILTANSVDFIILEFIVSPRALRLFDMP